MTVFNENSYLYEYLICQFDKLLAKIAARTGYTGENPVKLKELTEFLEICPLKDIEISGGFSSGYHSYRGDYKDLAFDQPEEGKKNTIGSMLDTARRADGAECTGWKGGEFIMGAETDCYIAQWGNSRNDDGTAPMIGIDLLISWAKQIVYAAEEAENEAGKCIRLEDLPDFKWEKDPLNEIVDYEITTLRREGYGGVDRVSFREEPQRGVGGFRLVNVLCGKPRYVDVVKTALREECDNVVDGNVEDGLHYSEIKGKITEIFETAKQTNKQIFLSTQSREVLNAIEAYLKTYRIALKGFCLAQVYQWKSKETNETHISLAELVADDFLNYHGIMELR